MPQWPCLGAQALIGTTVSAGIAPAMIVSFTREFALFCSVVTATLLGAAALGWREVSQAPASPGNLATVLLLAALGQQAARVLRLPEWALPVAGGAALCLMGLCGLLAWGLTRLAPMLTRLFVRLSPHLQQTRQ